MMSCITLYNSAFVPPGTGVQWMFFHTVFQSAVGHIWWFTYSVYLFQRYLCGTKYCTILYNLLLCALLDSISPCSSTYADSIAKRRRYSKSSGMASRNGGLAPFTFRSHVRIQADVIVTCFITCCRIRYKSKAWLLTGKFVMTQPSSSFDLYRVDRGTRNISPFHTNQEVVVFSWRTHTSGWGVDLGHIPRTRHKVFMDKLYPLVRSQHSTVSFFSLRP